MKRNLYRTPIAWYFARNLDSLALWADLYGLTTAYALWKNGAAEKRGTFTYFFRKNPFGGAYTLTLGQAAVVEFFKNVHFEEDDIAAIREIRGKDNEPIFTDERFFTWLLNLRPDIKIEAMLEGTIAFPREPVLQVTGNIAHIQLWEAVVLNQMNFWSLIGTKALRMVVAANGKPVTEGGLRRAQGFDGHLTAAIAAYMAGAAGSSNILTWKLFGIPTYGTHPHSWVMFWEKEAEAFLNFGISQPNNTVFLVDTYDTIEGVRIAIDVALTLKKMGAKLYGIRLDSGNLTELSKTARRMLDEAGLHDTGIIVSNDLDEYKIEEMVRAGAMVTVYAPGTALATGGDQAALGGVMKLVAVEDDAGVMQPRIKISGDAIKISIPGPLQVRRFMRGGVAVADAIYQPGVGFTAEPELTITHHDGTKHNIPTDAEVVELLQTVFDPMNTDGEVILPTPSIEAVRAYVKVQRASFPPELFALKVFELSDAALYPAGPSTTLQAKLEAMIAEKRLALSKPE